MIEKYNTIASILQNEIDNGNITLEFAESVNELAYEKYVTEAQRQGYDFKLNKTIDGCEISHYFYSDENDSKEVKDKIKEDLEKSLPVLIRQYSKIKNDIIEKASKDIKDINTNIKPKSVDFFVSGDRHQYEIWYKTKGTDTRTDAGEQDIDIEAHVTIVGNKIKKQWSTCHLG